MNTHFFNLYFSSLRNRTLSLKQHTNAHAHTKCAIRQLFADIWSKYVTFLKNELGQYILDKWQDYYCPRTYK